eukprot:jgi/Psemu1/11415/gm1.11415_g
MEEPISDIIHLNVGGTLFTSSVSTLVSSSSYFQSRLSQEWREESIDRQETIFIDQDPKAFSVLLSYMRLGHIEAGALTTPVLLLANFLGMEKLLNAVKQEARRSKFEERNLRLFWAAQGALLMKEGDVRKEYASLLFFNPDHMSFARHKDLIHDFVVNVEVPGQNGSLQRIPDCVTFLDGLNALNKLGYVRYEEDKLEMTDACYENVKARLFFSKLVTHDEEDMEVDSKGQHYTSDTSIFIESVRNKYKYYPRQFCCMIEKKVRMPPPFDDEDFSVLETEMGTKEETCEISTDSGSRFITQKVRTFARDDLQMRVEKYNWLQKKGYVYTETSIAQAFVKVIRCMNGGEPDERWGKNYSRSEVLELLHTLKAILPVGPKEWAQVAQIHNDNFPDTDRSVPNLCRKYNDLYQHNKVPTGDPNCPEEVKLVKRVIIILLIF